MIIISDTNILGSLAAGDSLALLFELFPKQKVAIPPAVQEELMRGFHSGKEYLKSVIVLIDTGQIEVWSLSVDERLLSQHLPNQLNAGECEGIALSQHRQGLFLSNDKRAIKYCQKNAIQIIDLPSLLRLFWTQKVLSMNAVRRLIQRMEQVENLKISQQQMTEIFARPNRRRR